MSGDCSWLAASSSKTCGAAPGAGFALHLHALGQGDRNPRAGRQQPRQRHLRAERWPRAVAQQLDQMVHALGQDRGAEVGLIGDPLVVEAEDVGEVGPPLDHLHREVPLGARLPAGELGLARRRPQQLVAERQIVADAVIDRGQIGWIADHGRELRLAAGAGP